MPSMTVGRMLALKRAACSQNEVASISAFSPISISGGDLKLADATFSDHTTAIVTSAVVTYQGLQVVCEGSAGATIDTIENAATWTWPISGGATDLTVRPFIFTLLERTCSVYPSLITVICGLTDSNTPKASTGNGFALEFGWPSTTVRRVGFHTKQGAGWTRVAGAGVDGTHFGADIVASRRTHTDIFTPRAYPRDAAGKLSSVPGVNTQGNTLQFTLAPTHFFCGVMWNSIAGATPTITFDPSYWIGPEMLHS